MGFFDSTINNFKTTADGEIIYYPFGVWGKGFVIPTLEKKQEIQRSMKRLLTIIFFSSIPLSIGLSGVIVHLLLNEYTWQWVLILLFTATLLIGILIWQYRFMVKLTYGLVQSNIKFSVLEAWANSAASMNFFRLVLTGIASLYFAFTGFMIAMYLQFNPAFFRPVGIVGFLFGCFGGIATCYMIVVKIKSYFVK